MFVLRILSVVRLTRFILLQADGRQEGRKETGRGFRSPERLYTSGQTGTVLSTLQCLRALPELETAMGDPSCRSVHPMFT